MDDSGTPTAPHGPDEVRAALVDAAARLFAERGPAAVSVRQIATEAGVNHGLVHHYFGSKEQLLHEVVRSRAERVIADMVAAFAEGPADREGLWAGRLWAAMTVDDGWKIVVRALLDGYGGDLLEPDTPRLDQMIDRIRIGQRLGVVADDVDPAAIVAFGTSLLWGALVMEPLLRRTPAGEMDPDELTEQLGRLWRRAVGFGPPADAGP